MAVKKYMYYNRAVKINMCNYKNNPILFLFYGFFNAITSIVFPILTLQIPILFLVYQMRKIGLLF